jgi:hypothetical protein
VTTTDVTDPPPEAELDSTTSKRYTNALIRASSRNSPVPIGFLCECADAECLKTVWLLRSEYDERQGDAEARLLAAGHTA